jgi:hypothetical protein
VERTRSGRRTVLWLLLFAGLVIAPTAGAALSASLDRYTIAMGETVQLTLRSDGEEDPAAADLTALEKDFDILQRSSSVSTRIVNGQRTQRRDLVLEITPRREGQFVIPPFRSGAARSEALSVRVTPEPDISPGEDIVLFEAQVDREQVYVQGQVLLTLRVQQAVNLDSRSVTELDIDGAFVKALGQNSYQRTIDGRPWLVHEIRYALFPESSGELRIPAQTFSGRLSSGRRSLFDTRPAGRLIRRSTDEISVDVLPRPGNAADGPWLPARDLAIEEQWSEEPQQLRVGESITRSITVSAQGLQGAQLPPLAATVPEGLRAYPDQPAINDLDGEQGVTGVRTDSTAIVALRPGDYTLPPVVIRWWDTVADRAREARLPERRLRVLPAASASDTAASDAPAARPLSPAAPTAGARFWPWVSASLALGWALTLFAWWSRGRRGSTAASAAPPPPGRDAILKACRRNDAVAAERALRDWLRHSGWRGTVEDWVAAQDRETLSTAVADLRRHLFGDADDVDAWDGTDLAAALRDAVVGEARRNTAAADSALPPLYPGTA